MLPKLADFGLSKLKTWLLPELTLNEFASRPFSPPEYDDGSYTIFQGRPSPFVPLALQCLSVAVIEDYKALEHALDTPDLPTAHS